MKRSEINELLLAPSESLQVELKSWLDLEDLDDRANVARALIALRNQNGGVLILGFDDKSLIPLDTGRPDDISKAYKADEIHRIVKNFAEPPFDVKVHFGERDGKQFPVVEVPSGVKAPVITSRDGPKIRQCAVYMRTTNNGRVESTEPRSAEDWEDLMRTCFDNREADIALFFRRHLQSIALEIKELPVSGSPIDQVFDGGSSAYIARVESIRTPPSRE